MGGHVGIVVHFQNVETEHTAGGELGVCAWINSAGWREHPLGDAILAVAGKDRNISIISVVESRVIHMLKGHASDVIDLCGCLGKPALLASLSKDGHVRVWDVHRQEAVVSLTHPGATSICLSPDGSHAIIGTKKGDLCRLHLPAALLPDQRKRKADGPFGGRLNTLDMAGAHAREMVDCLAYISPALLVSKSVDGRMHVWDAASMTSQASWRVPSGTVENEPWSRFAADPAGAFIAVGNSLGDLYIYESVTGKRLSHVEPIRVNAPMRGCCVSSDCRRVLAVLGNGFIFRYQCTAKQAGSEGATLAGKGPEVARIDQAAAQAVSSEQKENCNGNT
mmetsp:Transcript_40370/g.114287  ORF Transcript_40370/g.114287 Transcript_40370/m.114287 type:complete len:336 (+) Transcript_40370:195-1202(+)